MFGLNYLYLRLLPTLPMRQHKTAIFFLIVFLAISKLGLGQFYTGSQQDFGKNRVQYTDFNWLYYPDEKFEVYFYQGGKDLAEYTLKSAKNHLGEIEALLDFPLEEKIQIVVYNKQSEFRQSNVGLETEGMTNIGGTTQIVGSKMFVYYEGSHQELDLQIRNNLCRVLYRQLMYGGNWRNAFKNSALLSIPQWFEEGLLSYAEKSWSPEMESKTMNGVLTKEYSKFNRLSSHEAVFAGHSLWKYIADVYGENVIPNILYMTRVSRNIESGFMFVLGVSLATLNEDYMAYYENYFLQKQRVKDMPKLSPIFTQKQAQKFNPLPDLETQEELSKMDKRKLKKINKMLGELPVRHKKKYIYSQFKFSPDGEHMGFVTNEMGQYKVWLYNLESGKLKKLCKKEYKLERIVDDSFPILAWHPTSQVLTFTYERRGRAFLANYNLEEKKLKEKELFRIEKVVDLDYSDDGRKMVFSGVNEGQTDLYLYQVVGNNQQKLTNDIYDDMHPRFIRNSSAVIFASNRPDDTLRLSVPTEIFDLNKDIYILDVERPGSFLERITNTPSIDEVHPYAYDDINYTYLSEYNGTMNRMAAYVDSTISRIDTTVHYRFFTVSSPLSDFAYNPMEYDFNAKTGDYSLLFFKDNHYQVYRGNRNEDVQNLDELSEGLGEGSTNTLENREVLVFEDKGLKEGEIDIYNYQFEDDKRDYEFEKETIVIGEINKKGQAVDTLASDSSKAFVLPKSRNYRVNFATDFVLTQLTESFTNQFYQLFTGPTTLSPGLSGSMKMGASDLFEDYKLTGAFSLSGNLSDKSYGISYSDLSKRVDKIYTIERRTSRNIVADFSAFDIKSVTLQTQLKYPFTELAGVRLTGLYKNDQVVYLSTDASNLERPNGKLNTLGLKLEYVFDNTLKKGLNLYNGTRYKIWAEYYQDPTAEKSDVKVVGFDFRHYEKIHRDLIFAFRLAGNSSFGNRKVVHFLGGVDNWLFEKINFDTDISSSENYYYQALASPMRGFWVNSRNGSNFAVANAELRWPVFKYFINRPIKSDFIENFQFVSFFDAGSAWNGKHPFPPENENFNQEAVHVNPITVTIDNNRDPIIYGFGGGLRSRILGYYVRADWAWGVDDGVLLPHVFSVSLNLDF